MRTEQLESWEGEFGHAYTDRNQLDWQARLPAFQTMLGGLELGRDLPRVMGEIYRASRRYLLAIEYFAPEETVIHYRGHDNLLCKRDFPRHYQAQFPGLAVVRDGFWGREAGFDDSHWWLMEKGVR